MASTKLPSVESTKRTFIYNVVTVERVVDGDTCELLLDLGFNIFYKVTVRLQNLDTPERNTQAGKIVKAKVEEWLQGKTLVLVSKELDKFGRVLGVIKTVDEQELNSWLVTQGFARVYNGEKKTDWTKEQIERILNSVKE